MLCRGLYAEAVKSFEAAVALKPNSARTLFHLGNAQFALQLYAHAEKSFDMALKASVLHPVHLFHEHVISVMNFSPSDEPVTILQEREPCRKSCCVFV
jgi:tetratricopeptide (TPR) repeat protein